MDTAIIKLVPVTEEITTDLPCSLKYKLSKNLILAIKLEVGKIILSTLSEILVRMGPLSNVRKKTLYETDSENLFAIIEHMVSEPPISEELDTTRIF